jgi:TDG/mug DNA glycosylase family protein
MRTLPDHLRKGMKLVIVGCNPTDSSVRVGHYYAGRENPFWPTLFDSGVIPEPFDYHDDKRVIEFGIGLTDLVKKPSKTTDLLTREDFAEGRIVLSQKLEEFAPRVVAFNGKLPYEQFAQRKCKFGLQKEKLYGARVFVLPATPGSQPVTKAPTKSPTKPANNKEALLQFRKLAQLVKKVEKERDTAPLAGNRFANIHTSHSSQREEAERADNDDSGNSGPA